LKNGSWSKRGEVLTFSEKNLYGRINGGAELFFEFGFIRLDVQEYVHDEDRIIFEVYTMEDPIAALGIYLHKTLNETPMAGINSRNTANQYQINVCKGKYYIQVLCPSGKREYATLMAGLTNKITAQTPDIPEPAIFSELPKTGLIQGSEGIIRGTLSLQSIFTFGKGNIFQLSAKTTAVYADYYIKEQQNYTLLHVVYENSATAKRAFFSIAKNLDPYLEVIKTLENKLVFKDYNNKYGVIYRKERSLKIKIHLIEMPLN